MLLQVIYHLINDMTFISDMESSLKLLQPILAVLQSLEADKPFAVTVFAFVVVRVSACQSMGSC